MNDQLRYEVKLVLNERELNHALIWLNTMGAKKTFPNRKVNSLYFDNIAQEAIQHNLAGISNRNKVRLRWYGDNSSSISETNLEIKFREGRLGYKMKHPIYKKMINIHDQYIFKISNHIFKEINSSCLNHSVFNDYLVPMLMVKYVRKYFEIMNGIRITIDDKIQFYDVIKNIKLNLVRPLNYPQHVVEIKFSKKYKKKVSDLLRPTLLTPRRHSKYLVGLAKLGYISYI